MRFWLSLFVLWSSILLSSLDGISFEDYDNIKLLIEKYDKGISGEKLPDLHRDLLWSIYESFYSKYPHSTQKTKRPTEKHLQLFQRSCKVIQMKYYVDPCFGIMAHDYFKTTTGPTPKPGVWNEYFSRHANCIEGMYFLTKCKKEKRCNAQFHAFWKNHLIPLGTMREALLLEGRKQRVAEDDPFDHQSIPLLSQVSSIQQLPTRAEIQDVPGKDRKLPEHRTNRDTIGITLFIVSLNIILCLILVTISVNLFTKKNKA